MPVIAGEIFIFFMDYGKRRQDHTGTVEEFHPIRRLKELAPGDLCRVPEKKLPHIVGQELLGNQVSVARGTNQVEVTTDYLKEFLIALCLFRKLYIFWF